MTRKYFLYGIKLNDALAIITDAATSGKRHHARTIQIAASRLCPTPMIWKLAAKRGLLLPHGQATQAQAVALAKLIYSNRRGIAAYVHTCGKSYYGGRLGYGALGPQTAHGKALIQWADSGVM